MKIKQFLLLSAVAMSMSSCYTRIWTVAPTTEYVAPERTVYSTRVTTPTPRTTTSTTVTVTSFNNDWSFYLDLQAVAAAFAESHNVQEFERILNSSSYMINNLDLNGDGFIDYLRVIEMHQGYYHTFLIQACLAANVFQDVATLVAERMPDRLYVEVIGDPYLYGYNYIVRPTFVVRPPLWDVFGRPTYAAWNSPYYYGYWPNYYHQPKPVYLKHYQAYVRTYMHNHHYCHQCDYPEQPHYAGYSQMTQSYRRSDYAAQHPNSSFDYRVTNTLRNSGSTVTIRNAGHLRTESQRQEATQQQSTRQTTTTQQGSSRTSGTTQQGSTRQTNTTQQGSTRTTSTTSTRSTNKSEANQPSSTSVSTRVNKSGTTRTTVKQTDASGRTTTVQRTSTPTSTRTTGTSNQGSTRSSGSPDRTSDGSSRRR